MMRAYHGLGRLLLRARQQPARAPRLHRLSFGPYFVSWDDVIGRAIRRGESFEVAERVVLRRVVHEGNTALDIGANQGFFTLLLASLVGPTGRVVAFEPSPREIRRLRLNVRLNRLRNVKMEALALGAAAGQADLFVVAGQETGCNSLRPPATADPTERQRVRIVTLDDYARAAGLGRVDFVKLDVEGAELEVLSGANGMLSEPRRPMILCEVVDLRTAPWGYPARRIYDLLVTRGFEWFAFRSEGGITPCSARERFHENLLAVPTERLAEVAELIAEERTVEVGW
jgi:FkbM family methyltransferase